MMILPSLCFALAWAAPISIPLTVNSDGVFVDVQVNGRDMMLQLDTGFSGMVAVDSSVDIGKASSKVKVRDFVGVGEVETVALQSLKIGDFSADVRGQEAIHKPMGPIEDLFGLPVRGLLGLKPFVERPFTLDFAQRKLLIYPKGFDAIGPARSSGRSWNIGLLPRGLNHMQVELTTDAGRRLVMAIDTGNGSYAVTHRDTLERLGLWTPSDEPKFARFAWISSGTTKTWDLQMPGLHLSDLALPESVWSVIDLPSSAADSDGTLGYGFLRQFRVTVDYLERGVLFEQVADTLGNLGEADAGLGFALDKRKKPPIRRVSFLVPGGPADRAGVRFGDLLVSVEGKPSDSLTIADLKSKLNGKPGQKTSLVLRRGQTEIPVELELELMVNQVKGASRND